jgi:hypothetical protein
MFQRKIQPHSSEDEAIYFVEKLASPSGRESIQYGGIIRIPQRLLSPMQQLIQLIMQQSSHHLLLYNLS